MLDTVFITFSAIILLTALSFAVLALPLLAAFRLSRPSARPRLRKTYLAAGVALSVFLLAMHIRMHFRLASLRAEFYDASHMDSESCVRTDDGIIERRDAILRDAGYVGIGRWWARWGGRRP